MSLLRRRMISDGIETQPRYPMVNGSHIFSQGTSVEVTNGNHVLINKSSISQSFINVYNPIENSENENTSKNTDTLENVIFTLPKNATVEFRIKNAFGWGKSLNDLAVNMRRAKISTPVLQYGITKINEKVEPLSEEVVKTTEDAEEVGSIICFINKTLSGNATIEFDIELIVNGEKWI